MKKISLLLFIAASCLTARSQQWKTNLDDALKEAAVSNKDVLLFFSVSEACETCAKLDENVFRSKAFRSYASENYILVKQDFQSGNSAENIDENLLTVEKYNKDGFFPLVVAINKNGKVLGKIGIYKDESPEEYIAKLSSLKKS